MATNANTERKHYAKPAITAINATQRAELEAKARHGDKNALEVLSFVDRRTKKEKRKKVAVWMGVCGLLALCLAAYFLRR